MSDIWINSELNLFKTDHTWLGYSTITSVWWLEDGRGRFKIEGPLPASKELDNLKSGDTIEVIHHSFGRRDEYIPEKIIARLLNCQIKRKWMLNINPQNPSCQEVFVLYMSLTCNVELLV